MPLHLTSMNQLETNSGEIEDPVSQSENDKSPGRLETFIGFTGDFICKLVLKSLQDWQLFRLRLNGIGSFQRWCLHCAKVRQDISFTFLFTDLWTLKQKVEDSKDTAALSC